MSEPLFAHLPGSAGEAGLGQRADVPVRTRSRDRHRRRTERRHTRRGHGWCGDHHHAHDERREHDEGLDELGGEAHPLFESDCIRHLGSAVGIQPTNLSNAVSP